MNIVKSESLIQLQKTILGKRVRFVSDCHLFPNFDIRCKVVKIYLATNGEIIFEVIVLSNSKRMKIGGNMSNLSYELI